MYYNIRMKHKIVLFLACFSLLILANPVSAHQPRLIYNDVSTIEKPFIINNPDISQAYYGEFKNQQPEYFQVTLNQDGNLYLSLLTPYNQESAKEVSAVVIKTNSPDSSIAMSLSGKDFPWIKYYEDYAGDNYFQGPSLEKKLTAGTYSISVSSKNNTGKYVLVTGKIESFPFGEMIKALLNLPALKMVFFGTSFFSIFAGIIGKYLLYSLITLIIITILVGYLIKRKFNKRKNG